MRKILLWIAALVCLVSSTSSIAAVITYSATSLGGSNWRYEYTVLAESTDAPISEFTIYFDRTFFSNLSLDSSETNWDPLVIQPDQSLMSDGFLDALAIGAPLTFGDAPINFDVSFTYSGMSAPGAQTFEIVDPVSLAAVFTGLTTPSTSTPPTQVPEPQTTTLILLGLACWLGTRRNRRTRH